MTRLFKAFLFKLRKDMTFRVTLFIGVGLAVFMTLLYLIIEIVTNKAIGDGGEQMRFLTGEGMFYASLSPAQNFGITIPINLISFTVLEFTQGSIRNKIIAGNSKFKIYVSLFLNGLCFAFILISVYAGICTAFGSMHAGFNPNRPYVMGGLLSAEFLWKYILVTALAYISIVSVTIFFATLIRGIGGTIPIIIILIMAGYFAGMIVSSLSGAPQFETVNNILMWADPLYGCAATSANASGAMDIKQEILTAQIVCNVIWTVLFFALGSLIFAKRDVK